MCGLSEDHKHVDPQTKTTSFVHESPFPDSTVMFQPTRSKDGSTAWKDLAGIHVIRLTAGVCRF